MDQEEFNRQFQQYAQSWIKSNGKRGMYASLTGSNSHKSEVRHMRDSMPKLEYHWFSDEQMYMMDNHPFEEGCPVQLLDMTIEEVFQCPMLRQSYYLMDKLTKKELSLDTSGYLPPSMVEELYERGSGATSMLCITNFAESEVAEVRLVHIALLETGLIAEDSGKMSLTDKGKKMLTDQNALLRTIITYLFRDFDTSSLDSHENPELSNPGRLYSLWLLHHFGNGWHGPKFYEKEYFNAYPLKKGVNNGPIRSFIKPSSIYSSRIFKHLFLNLGLCERFLKFGDDGYKKSVLLQKMFSFEEPPK